MSKFSGGGLSKASVQGMIEEALLPIRRLFEALQEEIAKIRERLDDLEEPPEPDPGEPEEPQEPPEEPEDPQEPEEPGEPGEPQEPEEPQEPTPIHRLMPTIDENFDEANPTIKDRGPMTSTERYYYKAFKRGFLRPDPDVNTGPHHFGRQNSYHLGRHGQVIQGTALLAQARTGDASILDQLVRYWRLAYDDLRVTWRADNVDLTHSVFKHMQGATIKDGAWTYQPGFEPWSPYKKWLYDWGSPSEGRGTDLNNLQNIKPWSILTRFLWTLEVNRGKRSPAGFDYGSEADKWREPLKGFILQYTSDTGEPWEANYRGLDGGLFWKSYRTRAEPGQWPFFARGEGHAIYNSAMLCYYCGLLGEAGWDIPNWQDAIPGADLLFGYIRDNLVPSVDSNGKPSLIARGGGAWAAMNATYTNYLALSLQEMRDIGRWRDDFSDGVLAQLARSYADMHRPDGTTLKNLASEVDRTGHGLKVDGGSDRSVHQQVISGFCGAMLWEDGRYLFDVATAAQESRFGGGYEDAKVHVLPAFQFVREVGV